jgi:hypothetical protein
LRIEFGELLAELEASILHKIEEAVGSKWMGGDVHGL